jgi:hypothetical protein
MWVSPDQSTIRINCGFRAWPHNVPDENIGKNLEELCIRRGNLKYIDDEIVDANL